MDEEQHKKSTLADTYPNVANFVLGDGWIELGYDPNTGTYARALDEGGAIWMGGSAEMILEELLDALEQGIADAQD